MKQLPISSWYSLNGLHFIGNEFEEQHNSEQLSVMISEQSVDEMNTGINRKKKPRAKSIEIFEVLITEWKTLIQHKNTKNKKTLKHEN